MNKVISGKSILRNIKSNSTFIAGDVDEEVGIRPNGVVEWVGELSVAATDHEYRPIAEALWAILDNVDTASDIYKPSDSNLDGYKGFYRFAMVQQKARWEFLTNDDDQNKLVKTPQMMGHGAAKRCDDLQVSLDPLSEPK